MDWDLPANVKDMRDMGLPEGAGLVFTEPRTVDCNGGDENQFPDDSLTTENLAHDLVAMVRSLGLKNYVIYGHSYGTVLSTTFAHLAEQDGGPGPMAVILTGVLGRSASNGEGSVFKWLNLEWLKLQPALPEAAKKRLLSSQLPYGLSEDEWGDVVEDGVYLGRVFLSGVLSHPLTEAFKLIAQNTASSDRDALKIFESFHTFNKRPSEDVKWSQRLFEVIDCAELSDSEPIHILKNGQLVPVGDDCEERPKLTRPFDAGNYQIKAPIYYFQGTNDPATPDWHAKYHYQSQKMSHKTYVTIEQGGHNRIGLYFDDCKQAIWKSIFDHGKNFAESLKTCRFRNYSSK